MVKSRDLIRRLNDSVYPVECSAFAVRASCGIQRHKVIERHAKGTVSPGVYCGIFVVLTSLKISGGPIDVNGEN